METVRCTTGENCGHIMCSGCFPETQQILETTPIEPCNECGNNHIGECYRIEDDYVEESDNEETRYQCEYCGNTPMEVMRCVGCRDVYYCGRSCQKKHWREEHRYTCERQQRKRRRKFQTPCGQTYWTDEEYLLYTNKDVETPIGYWSKEHQAIYFSNESDSESDYESDDDYYGTPPPTPPPTYEESNDSEEIEGETILLGERI